MSSKPLILIVEDEKDLADLIGQQIETGGMNAQVCYRPSMALRYLEKQFANLLLLDVNLPEMTGFELLSELRRREINSPVIFLTGNNTEVAKVRGLEMGGDDYITKPFSSAELLARIRAVLRRAETSMDKQVTKNASLAQEPFQFDQSTVFPDRMEVQFPDGQVEEIGRKELGILSALVQHAGTVLSRRTLIHMVWGIHADVRSRSLDQYVVRIRNAHARHGSELSSFRTVHGVGYIYDPEGKRPDMQPQGGESSGQ